MPQIWTTLDRHFSGNIHHSYIKQLLQHIYQLKASEYITADLSTTLKTITESLNLSLL